MVMEKGFCGYFDKMKYFDGIFLIDIYKKEIDDIVLNDFLCDWEFFRECIK